VRPQRPGLVALKEVAQCPPKLGTYEVGFQLGRASMPPAVETAEASLHLLLRREAALPCPSPGSSMRRIASARKSNAASSNKSPARYARGSILKPTSSSSKAVARHIGVVGIVASRVLQEFYRPTIIVGARARTGAARAGASPVSTWRPLCVDVTTCSSAMAPRDGGGITIRPDQLDAFRQRLNELARRAFKPEDLQPPVRLDAEVGLDESHCPRSPNWINSVRPAWAIPTCNSSPAISRTSTRSTHRRREAARETVGHRQQRRSRSRLVERRPGICPSANSISLRAAGHDYNARAPCS